MRYQKGDMSSRVQAMPRKLREKREARRKQIGITASKYEIIEEGERTGFNVNQWLAKMTDLYTATKPTNPYIYPEITEKEFISLAEISILCPCEFCLIVREVSLQ